MNKGRLALLTSAMSASVILALAPAAVAQQNGTAGETVAADVPGEILVTARRREERLQDVPDSITGISSAQIENSGIAKIDDFARLVPNLTFRNNKAFSGGDLKLSMRGIGNGQQGWPSVSVIVDGVPVDSLDNLAGNNYGDLERIEVLRGPQSALYGANAIAGAINIITRQPTSELSGRFFGQYATGDDKRFGAALSGPLIADRIAFRVQAEGIDADGLTKSASNGRDLDFTRSFRTRGSLLFTPVEALSLELRGEYNRTRVGSTYQGLVPSPAQGNDFSDIYDPRRRLIGEEKRTSYRFSLRATYDFDAAQLVSVTAYNRSRQNIGSSVCYNDPDNPFDTGAAPGAQAVCLLGGTAFGSAATAGQLVDEVFVAFDGTRSFYQDLRLQSSGSGPFQWLIGASYMNRTAENGFDVRDLIAGPAGGAGCGRTVGYDPTGCGSAPIIFPAWHRRSDDWWGIYAQASYEVMPSLELTLAGRYDRQIYRNTQYSERGFVNIVPVPTANGVLVPTQREEAKNFQPKAQLSYKINPDAMVYATYARGFRAGFFNTGSFAAPETTSNYEIGAKTAFATGAGRLTLNASAFHIDYSNQQFSTVVTVPPFRVPITIPETKINGAEVEAGLFVGDGLSFSASAGYLDAKITNGGGRSPLSPQLTTNVAVDYDHAVSGDLGLILHADWRRATGMDLNTAPVRDQVPTKNYINLRAGLSWSGFTLSGFVENLTNEREETQARVPIGTALVRYFNDPRRHGVELKYSF